MLNLKKLQVAYRRYSKNFVDGIKFETVQAKYEKNHREIVTIVESNDVERDHILLIDLNPVSSYYLSKWKNDVLLHGGKHTEPLKTMHMVVFYQCMAQELYQIRYPKMWVEYNFGEVVAALIHFTMFGWEKEEALLFDFIDQHLGRHIMDANEYKRHVWFLLELYLQYRNKTIAGTRQNVKLALRQAFQKNGLKCDLIPDDLDIYEDVLERWNTTDPAETEQLLRSMSRFHSDLASELGNSLEFGDFRFAFYPYEMLFLLHIRKKLGLPVPRLADDFLLNTPEACMEFQAPEPYPEWDPSLRLIDNFYRKHYPDYIPNRHGALFQA
ncbi:hypothetical protein [Paenibacillus sp. y28]|uniref:hypothetical protein n=1 Tax=Paenibacillus sp. y28 TaxID=3129110 RepID=UPI0030186D5B